MTDPADDVLLTPCEAGREFTPQLSSDAVKTHDDALQPLRTPSGRRLYRRSVVRAYAAEHAARRAAKLTAA